MLVIYLSVCFVILVVGLIVFGMGWIMPQMECIWVDICTEDRKELFEWMKYKMTSFYEMIEMMERYNIMEKEMKSISWFEKKLGCLRRMEYWTTWHAVHDEQIWIWREGRTEEWFEFMFNSEGSVPIISVSLSSSISFTTWLWKWIHRNTAWNDWRWLMKEVWNNSNTINESTNQQVAIESQYLRRPCYS